MVVRSDCKQERIPNPASAVSRGNSSRKIPNPPGAPNGTSAVRYLPAQLVASFMAQRVDMIFELTQDTESIRASAYVVGSGNRPAVPIADGPHRLDTGTTVDQ